MCVYACASECEEENSQIIRTAKKKDEREREREKRELRSRVARVRSFRYVAQSRKSRCFLGVYSVKQFREKRMPFQSYEVCIHGNDFGEYPNKFGLICIEAIGCRSFDQFLTRKLKKKKKLQRIRLIKKCNINCTFYCITTQRIQNVQWFFCFFFLLKQTDIEVQAR